MNYFRTRGHGSQDRFGIQFPDMTDVHSKIVLVASTLLLDYLYFEYIDSGNSDEEYE